jgi:2-phospho-L-lactate/phosphoenolpyruvate guanylyltransferase
MNVWAIIPVKPPTESKSRLAHLLSSAARADLICGFLQNTLAVLQQVDGVTQILVVSSDPLVWAIARRNGVVLLEEERPFTLNNAVTQATHYAAAHGAQAVLILPADLPFLQASDVQRLLDRLVTNPSTLVIAGDERAAGTNALLIAPPVGFAFHYGPGSFQAHLLEAHHSHRTSHVIHSPGLQFDLDTETDWQFYQRARSQIPSPAGCG